MYKLLFLLVVLFALTAYSFGSRQEKKCVQMSGPVMTGSPILVLNN